MPLPKAPSRPADTVELTKAVLAKRANSAGKPRANHRPVEPTSATSAAPTPQARPLGLTAASPASTSVSGTARQAVSGSPAGRMPDRAVAEPEPVAIQIETISQKATPAGPATRLNKSRRRQKISGQQRLFVLDTNVLMHDPSCMFRFAEHDVFLPIITLEELDNHKRGASEVSRNVRQVSRSLDNLLAQSDNGIEAGVSLSVNGSAAGRLYFQGQALEFALPEALPVDKADNAILMVVAALKEQRSDREVVLVSKDINMRIKATMLGLAAEDYFSDQVIEDADLLDSGVLKLPEDFWESSKDIESWQENGRTLYRLSGLLTQGMSLNQFVYFDGEMPLTASVIERTDRHVKLRTTRDFSNPKHSLWGITARNREQNFAMNLLTDPDIDFVSLLGQAGTGKTLLALAAGLAQVLDEKRYSEIIVTRATVPVGDDIGYLPGTEEEKMQPWMGALQDNLEVLNESDPSAGEWGRSASEDLLKSRIKIKSLAFMRGRTFINKFLIIDEAQNLTPKQMKTLITRAGPGTKIVCLGNVAQIDTPYLTEASSGLTFVVDRMKGWAHAGHITLERGERSRLADFASEAL